MVGSTLVRSRIALDESPQQDVSYAAAASEDLKLGHEVKQTLGYMLLNEITTKPTFGRFLAQTLNRLEIEPFTKESVGAYKEEQQELHNWCGDLNRKRRDQRCEKFVYGGLIALAAAFILGLSLAAISSRIFHSVSATPLWLLALAGFLTFAGGICATPERENWTWQRVRIDQYKKPIPQFALRKALMLKQELPEVQIFVEELMFQQRTGDPFLVAVCGDREEYFEVFDEPAFERNL